MINNSLTSFPQLVAFRVAQNASQSGAITYTMKLSDFPKTKTIGVYLVLVTNWETSPVTAIYIVSFSGNNVNNSTVQTLLSGTGSCSVSNGVITVSGGGISIFSF